MSTPFDSTAGRQDHEECSSIGLCSRLLRRPRHRTDSSSMETTRYRGHLRQMDAPFIGIVSPEFGVRRWGRARACVRFCYQTDCLSLRRQEIGHTAEGPRPAHSRQGRHPRRARRHARNDRLRSVPRAGYGGRGLRRARAAGRVALRSVGQASSMPMPPSCPIFGCCHLFRHALQAMPWCPLAGSQESVGWHGNLWFSGAEESCPASAKAP